MTKFDTRYRINDESTVVTPALAVYPQLVYENIQRLVADAGDARRLRPHAKTHKTPQIVSFLHSFGITKHKCATIAEAEMLANEHAEDVLIAYPMVGPNVARLLELQARYPKTKFSTLVDHPDHIGHLSSAAQQRSRECSVFLDVDVGMHRTGVGLEQAQSLYSLMDRSPGISPLGLHVYDGHVTDSDTRIRAEKISEIWNQIQEYITKLEKCHHQVSTIVVTGTGGFPHWAQWAATDSRIECSPGTLVFNDAGYSARYQDLDYPPATVLLGRVISKPGKNRLTIDLGSKAVAPDCDVSKRVQLLNVPEATILSQHEEHLVVETPVADDWPIGSFIYAWPNHICPTVALHQELLVIENGDVVDTWPVVARDRRIQI